MTLRQEKKGIFRINRELNELINDFDSRKDENIIMLDGISSKDNDRVVFIDVPAQGGVQAPRVKKKLPPSASQTNDPTMQTPFGKQYGVKVNSIINDICSKADKQVIDTETTASILCDMYNGFYSNNSSITLEEHGEQIMEVIDSIIFVDTDIMSFSELFLYRNRKESFPKFFQLNSSAIDAFFSVIFKIYFQERFKPFLKFIKTDEMMTFTCAFIIKRIYIMFGDAITIFGFFLIKAVAAAGKVQIGRA